MVRSSEFWMSILMVIGYAGTTAGWWTAADYQRVLEPALVYIVGRVMSKAAKAALKPAPSPEVK